MLTIPPPTGNDTRKLQARYTKAIETKSRVDTDGFSAIIFKFKNFARQLHRLKNIIIYSAVNIKNPVTGKVKKNIEELTSFVEEDLKTNGRAFLAQNIHNVVPVDFDSVFKYFKKSLKLFKILSAVIRKRILEKKQSKGSFHKGRTNTSVKYPSKTFKNYLPQYKNSTFEVIKALKKMKAKLKSKSKTSNQTQSNASQLPLDGSCSKTKYSLKAQLKNTISRFKKFYSNLGNIGNSVNKTGKNGETDDVGPNEDFIRIGSLTEVQVLASEVETKCKESKVFAFENWLQALDLRVNLSENCLSNTILQHMISNLSDFINLYEQKLEGLYKNELSHRIVLESIGSSEVEHLLIENEGIIQIIINGLLTPTQTQLIMVKKEIVYIYANFFDFVKSFEVDVGRDVVHNTIEKLAIMRQYVLDSSVRYFNF